MHGLTQYEAGPNCLQEREAAGRVQGLQFRVQGTVSWPALIGHRVRWHACTPPGQGKECTHHGDGWIGAGDQAVGFRV